MPLTYRRPGQVCIEHSLDVPLDHADPDGPSIELFAREVVSVANAGKQDVPALLFLQGGPGCAADRPSSATAWLERALRHYRVVLLDQRGTGASSPVNRQSLAGLAATEQATYLRHFRADAIVRDAELLRSQLIGERSWSVLGQSFGGFCALTYLSLAPHGLSGVMISGGMPSLTASVDEIYRAAYPRAVAHNDRFFARYPADRKLARQVIERLADTDTRLPSGERLTPQRFQMLGTTFGAAGTFDALHYLLERPLCHPAAVPCWRTPSCATSTTSCPCAIGHYMHCYMSRSIVRRGRRRGRRIEYGRSSSNSTSTAATRCTSPPRCSTPGHLTKIPPWHHCATAPNTWPSTTRGRRCTTWMRWPPNAVPVAAVVHLDDLYVDAGHSIRTAAVVRNLSAWVNERAQRTTP
jgi:pimeloyl-ACP methyl ester carboxylesterase